MQVFERILRMVDAHVDDLIRQKKEAVDTNNLREAALIEGELAGVKTVLVIARTEMMKEDE